MPTLYDLTIPAYANGLRALSGQLVKALDWGEQNGVGELQFVAARLAPDMFPLAAQVRFSCAQAIQTAMRRIWAKTPPIFRASKHRSRRRWRGSIRSSRRRSTATTTAPSASIFRTAWRST